MHRVGSNETLTLSTSSMYCHLVTLCLVTVYGQSSSCNFIRRVLSVLTNKHLACFNFYLEVKRRQFMPGKPEI